MKLVKVTLCALALVALSPNAHASLGKMATGDVRDGQLLCPKVRAKMEAERRAQEAANKGGNGEAQTSISAN